MNLLALDTSTEYCSVAVWRDGALAERDVHAGQSHSELLLGMIDEVLKEAGVTLRQLDGIAYGEGPGTFTGLRIACGVTQGLAYAADLRVAGVGTLLALAAGSGGARALCCLDARMHQVYFAAYERTEEGWIAVHAPVLCDPGEVPAVEGGGWIACGSGFAAYHDVLAGRYGGHIERMLPDAHPRARDIARLAVPVFERGDAAPPEAAAPVYLRDKVALKTHERAA